MNRVNIDLFTYNVLVAFTILIDPAIYIGADSTFIHVLFQTAWKLFVVQECTKISKAFLIIVSHCSICDLSIIEDYRALYIYIETQAVC